MPPKKVTPNGKAAEPVGAKLPPAKKTASKAKAKPAAKKSSSTKYVRNVRGVDVRVTFDSGRKIQLNARGQRNDMAAISKEELDDPIFLENLGTLYEVITSAEAEKIREKQMTNAFSSPSPRPEDILRSEHDRPANFTGLTPSNQDISITVGQLNEVEGRPNEDKATEITRSVQPERANVPGSSLDEYGKPISIAPLPPISERE